MSAQFCGQCGSQKLSENDLYCRTCGRPYSIQRASQAIAEESAIHNEPEQIGSRKSAQELKTKWLDFWIYVHLPLGVIVGVPLALSQAGSPELLFGTIVVELPIICLAVGLFVGLRKRRLWAWQLNWVYLLLGVFGMAASRASRVSATDVVATYAGALIASVIFWGTPNYFYFKRRRSLFSGPPFVEGGIKGVIGAIARFIWPSVGSPEAARKASREGFCAAAIMTVVTLILVSFAALGHSLFGVGVVDLLDASISAAIAWGIYKLSRTASVLGILFFIIEQIISWTTITPGSVSGFCGSALTTSILALMFFNGARGTFAYQRRQKSLATETGGVAPVTSTHWKVYSAVLASFVLGVLALRIYQSLTGQVHVNQTATAREGEDLTALVKQTRPAVVTITVFDSNGKSIAQGSGFFVSKKGEILTNHHVLKGGSSAEIKMSDGTTHRIAAVLADDPDSDLTKIIAPLDDDTPFLPLAHQRSEVGQRIVVIGSPMGLEETVSEGIVSALPEERQEVGEVMPATLQITAPISEGSSGGPVLNLKGEVVGVAAAYLKKTENLNFAIPLEQILVLKRIKPVALDVWSNPSKRPSAYDSFSEGLASMQLNECEQGLLSFRLAANKRPNFAWAWWGMGVCFEEVGDPDKAIVALKQASEVDPSIGPPHYALGLIYAGQGQRLPAQKQYELLKTLDPDLASKLKSQLPQ